MIILEREPLLPYSSLNLICSELFCVGSTQPFLWSSVVRMPGFILKLCHLLHTQLRDLADSLFHSDLLSTQEFLEGTNIHILNPSSRLDHNQRFILQEVVTFYTDVCVMHIIYRTSRMIMKHLPLNLCHPKNLITHLM